MEENLKQLLLKDICARLSYGIEISCVDGTSGMITSISIVPHGTFVTVYFNRDSVEDVSLEDIKPYLRSLSSMTKEEKKELKEEHKKDEKVYAEILEKISKGDESARGTAIPHFAADWCNAHYFDYRGLILWALSLKHLRECMKIFKI